jgi:hypothetical protein
MAKTIPYAYSSNRLQPMPEKFDHFKQFPLDAVPQFSLIIWLDRGQPAPESPNAREFVVIGGVT